MSTDSHKHGGKALSPEILQGQVRSESNCGSDRDSVFENIVYFAVQHLRRQAVVGNPDPQHAAQLIEGLEDCDLKTFQPQIIRHRKTGRPGADDGHLLGSILDLR